ncbi:hypothetical protein FACS1894193_08560 [Bacilli bacterium]|nr:hypothetical protein FACS1894192_00210 [Bacilli bacterium]GHU42733.1 hypothetical protein FACS1894193_08560 [Bacilli bacterium]
MKVAHTVWSEGKAGDNFKCLPIAIKPAYISFGSRNDKELFTKRVSYSIQCSV